MPILTSSALPVRARFEDSAQELSPQETPEVAVSWRQEMKSAVRSPVELCQLLDLPENLASSQAAKEFPVFVPRGYLARIEKGNPSDPLLRQVLPLSSENQSPVGFSTDPVGDQAATLRPGLLHKYAGRALLITTGACAVHCRYCFRRHFPYGEAPKSPTAWASAIEAIREDSILEEVILSGGDPLTLADAQLGELAQQLETIPHVRRLRIHTRLPVMISQRVTQEMLSWLTGGRLTPIMVIHANHAQEIDQHVGAAISRLVNAGVPVLNQAVLLRGINDSVTALCDLSERLVNLRVMPYYLHQLDQVTGAAHFEVPIEEGKAIVEKMRRRLPGYAVPRYVQEIAGEANKVVLA